MVRPLPGVQSLDDRDGKRDGDLFCRIHAPGPEEVTGLRGHGFGGEGRPRFCAFLCARAGSFSGLNMRLLGSEALWLCMPRSAA